MYEIFFALYEKAMCNIHPLCSPRSTPTWPFDVKPPTYEPIGLIPTRELQGNSCRQQASACRGSSVSQPAAKSIKDKSGRSGRIAYAPRNLCIPVWLKFTNRNLEHSEHISEGRKRCLLSVRIRRFAGRYEPKLISRQESMLDSRGCASPMDLQG